MPLEGMSAGFFSSWAMSPALRLDQASNGGDPVFNELLPFVIHSLYPIESCHGVSEAQRVVQQQLRFQRSANACDQLGQQQS